MREPVRSLINPSVAGPAVPPTGYGPRRRVGILWDRRLDVALDHGGLEQPQEGVWPGTASGRCLARKVSGQQGAQQTSTEWLPLLADRRRDATRSLSYISAGPATRSGPATLASAGRCVALGVTTGSAQPDL